MSGMSGLWNKWGIFLCRPLEFGCASVSFLGVFCGFLVGRRAGPYGLSLCLLRLVVVLGFRGALQGNRWCFLPLSRCDPFTVVTSLACP